MKLIAELRHRLFPSALPRPTAGDFWASLAASALLLPQAMAFGIALWLPITHDAGAAALSGMLTTVWLCLGSGVLRGTQGVVSAPTGPSLALIAGSTLSLTAAGIVGSQLASAISLVILFAGIFHLLIAFFGLGGLIKFIPYPVISGFMSGSALVMILSQQGSILGDGDWFALGWITTATALCTFACMQLLPRWFPRLPNTILGMIGGTVIFYLLLLLQRQGRPPSDWIVGTIPTLDAIPLGLPDWNLAGLPLSMLMLHGLALAVLTSLNSLLVAMIADLNSGHRHHTRRELAGLGLGHLLSALSGGTTGSATTGATIISVKSGGRQWAALLTAAIFLVILLFMGPVAAWLPISVFSGIILHVAVMTMFDRDMLGWLANRPTRLDGAIALLVTGVTVFYNLITAIALGLILAVIEFIRTQTLSTVVHHRWTLEQRTSMRHRTTDEKELLQKHADRVVLYELKGNLFFGTADHMYDTMQHDFKHACCVVLDMRRVSQIDLTARHMLQQMCAVATLAGGKVMIAHAPKSLLGSPHRDRPKSPIPFPTLPSLQADVFPDTDEALEAAENKLLERLGSTLHLEHHRLQLSDFPLFEDFLPEEMRALEPLMSACHFKTGEDIFHAGAPGASMFFVLHGQVDIRLNYRKRQWLRLAKFGSGTFFGEVSLLEPGVRSADARAVTELHLLELTEAGLEQLKRDHPAAALKLLTALGREASRHLRLADLELQRMAIY